MTLAEKLQTNLTEWSPVGEGRHSLAATYEPEGWSICVTADKVDTLSCLLWELTLTRTGNPPKNTTLHNWAEAVAKRVSGLLEPLSIYEVEPSVHEAVIRSSAPTRRGDRLAYYEVSLHGTTTAVLRRYSASKTSSGRQQVPFALTHEALAKVVGDITG